MTDVTGAGDGRRTWRTIVVPVVSAGDGVEHLVAESAMTPGSAGRYVACCGRVVWAASLSVLRVCGVRPVSRRALPTQRGGDSTTASTDLECGLG